MRDRHITLEENDTTRRFHRTVSEAFKDAEYGSAIERPRPKTRVDALCWLLAIELIVVVLTSPHWWPR